MRNFKQREPDEGEAATEATEVRFLYDTEKLYIGVTCFDSEPENIVSQTLLRDNTRGEDQVSIILDTFHDHRNAYLFETTPRGALLDALVTDEGADFNGSWDGIWIARTQITQEGWVAEFSIPFKTLNFDPRQTSWGINVQRRLQREEEQALWTAFGLNEGILAFSEAGHLTGLEDIEQGVGLDIRPFGVSTWREDQVGTAGTSLQGDSGFDLFYDIAPSLTLTLTYNTDFAETEVDQRQVNLTRFPLFFPEKRDFFLESAGTFEFGRELGGFGSPGRPVFREDDLLPFFSRRIGLSEDGEEISLLGGVKLTGWLGDFNIGFLDVYTEEDGGQPEENFTVFRLKQKILGESNIGVLMTHREPKRGNENSLLGIDLNYATSRFFGAKKFLVSAQLLRSVSPELAGDEFAGRVNASYPNDTWYAAYQHTDIGEDFQPGVGFVRRVNLREEAGFFQYAPRPEVLWIRQLEFGAGGRYLTDQDGHLQTRVLVSPVEIRFESGDEIEYRYRDTFERLTQPFEIREAVFIPIGEYSFERHQLMLRTARRRKLSTSLSVEGGDFFDGDRTEYFAEIRWSMNAHLSFNAQGRFNDIDLPSEKFITRIYRFRTDIGFTPLLFWRNLLQFDNDSNVLGFNSRLRWIIVPGTELFLIFNQNWLDERDSIFPTGRDSSVKLEYTYRF